MGTEREEQERLLRAAFRLAESARASGNHPFGALLARAGEPLVTAENTVSTSGDATAHAELNLVQAAARSLGREGLAGSTVYASTEPCAMCAGALYWAGVSRVIFGLSAEALGALAGGSLVIPCREIFARGRRRVEVIGPLLEDEARAPHSGFWK